MGKGFHISSGSKAPKLLALLIGQIETLILGMTLSLLF